MALSGIINGTTNNQYIACKAAWSATQSVSGNYSDVTVTLTYWRTNTGYTTSGTLVGKVYINGVATSYSKYVQLTYNSNTAVCTATTRVYHNNDGTKLITISATGAISGTSLSSTSLSDSVTLNTIPRASTPALSASSVNMGSAVTISTNRASTSFTHTLTYSFGNTSGTIATSVGTSQSWTPPLTLANQIPNATSGTCTITCKTYSGSTLIGTKTVSLTLKVPSSVVPIVSSVSISEATSGLATKFQAYVQNKSKLHVSITAAGIYGSTISSYETSVQSVVYRGSSFTSNVITASGTISIVTTVKDSRGRTARHTQSITVLAYSPPKISKFSAWRIDTSGNDSEEGTRIALKMKFAISEVGNRNDRTYNLKYRKSIDSTFTSFESGTASWTYDDTEYFTTSPELSIDNAYIFRLEISDYFQTVAYEIQVSTAFTLLDFRSTGKGISIGKVSEKDAFEVALPTEFLKNVSAPNLYDLTQGVAIPSGANLDNYKDIGIYYSANASITNSLINTPYTGSNFRLIVEQLGAPSYRRQTILTRARTYVRYWEGTAWQSWTASMDTGAGLTYPYSSSTTVGVLKNIITGNDIYPVWGCVDITDLGLNLNNLTYSGLYMWRGTTPTNGIGTWKFLINMRFTGYGVQLCFGFGGASAYYRYSSSSSSSGSWSAWTSMSLS